MGLAYTTSSFSWSMAFTRAAVAAVQQSVYEICVANDIDTQVTSALVTATGALTYAAMGAALSEGVVYRNKEGQELAVDTSADYTNKFIAGLKEAMPSTISQLTGIAVETIGAKAGWDPAITSGVSSALSSFTQSAVSYALASSNAQSTISFTGIAAKALAVGFSNWGMEEVAVDMDIDVNFLKFVNVIQSKIAAARKDYDANEKAKLGTPADVAGYETTLNWSLAGSMLGTALAETLGMLTSAASFSWDPKQSVTYSTVMSGWQGYQFADHIINRNDWQERDKVSARTPEYMKTQPSSSGNISFWEAYTSAMQQNFESTVSSQFNLMIEKGMEGAFKFDAKKTAQSLIANNSNGISFNQATGIYTLSYTQALKNTDILRYLSSFGINLQMGESISFDYENLVNLAGGGNIFNGTLQREGVFKKDSNTELADNRLTAIRTGQNTATTILAIDSEAQGKHYEIRESFILTDRDNQLVVRNETRNANGKVTSSNTYDAATSRWICGTHNPGIWVEYVNKETGAIADIMAINTDGSIGEVIGKIDNLSVTTNSEGVKVETGYGTLNVGNQVILPGNKMSNTKNSVWAVSLDLGSGMIRTQQAQQIGSNSTLSAGMYLGRSKDGGIEVVYGTIISLGGKDIFDTGLTANEQIKTTRFAQKGQEGPTGETTKESIQLSTASAILTVQGDRIFVQGDPAQQATAFVFNINSTMENDVRKTSIDFQEGQVFDVRVGKDDNPIVINGVTVYQGMVRAEYNSVTPYAGAVVKFSEDGNKITVTKDSYGRIVLNNLKNSTTTLSIAGFDWRVDHSSKTLSTNIDAEKITSAKSPAGAGLTLGDNLPVYLCDGGMMALTTDISLGNGIIAKALTTQLAASVEAGGSIKIQFVQMTLKIDETKLSGDGVWVGNKQILGAMQPGEGTPSDVNKGNRVHIHFDRNNNAYLRNGEIILTQKGLIFKNGDEVQITGLNDSALASFKSNKMLYSGAYLQIGSFKLTQNGTYNIINDTVVSKTESTILLTLTGSEGQQIDTVMKLGQISLPDGIYYAPDYQNFAKSSEGMTFDHAGAKCAIEKVGDKYMAMTSEMSATGSASLKGGDKSFDFSGIKSKLTIDLLGNFMLPGKTQLTNNGTIILAGTVRINPVNNTFEFQSAILDINKNDAIKGKEEALPIEKINVPSDKPPENKKQKILIGENEKVTTHIDIAENGEYSLYGLVGFNQKDGICLKEGSIIEVQNADKNSNNSVKIGDGEKARNIVDGPVKIINGEAKFVNNGIMLDQGIRVGITVNTKSVVIDGHKMTEIIPTAEYELAEGDEGRKISKQIIDSATGEKKGVIEGTVVKKNGQLVISWTDNGKNLESIEANEYINQAVIVQDNKESRNQSLLLYNMNNDVIAQYATAGYSLKGIQIASGTLLMANKYNENGELVQRKVFQGNDTYGTQTDFKFDKNNNIIGYRMKTANSDAVYRFNLNKKGEVLDYAVTTDKFKAYYGKNDNLIKYEAITQEGIDSVEATKNALPYDSSLKRSEKGVVGVNEIKVLQAMLGLKQDGVFGSQTEKAVLGLMDTNQPFFKLIKSQNLVGTFTMFMSEVGRQSYETASKRIQGIIDSGIHTRSIPTDQGDLKEETTFKIENNNFTDVKISYKLNGQAAKEGDTFKYQGENYTFIKDVSSQLIPVNRDLTVTVRQCANADITSTMGRDLKLTGDGNERITLIRNLSGNVIAVDGVVNHKAGSYTHTEIIGGEPIVEDRSIEYQGVALKSQNGEGFLLINGKNSVRAVLDENNNIKSLTILSGQVVTRTEIIGIDAPKMVSVPGGAGQAGQQNTINVFYDDEGRLCVQKNQLLNLRYDQATQSTNFVLMPGDVIQNTSRIKQELISGSADIAGMDALLDPTTRPAEGAVEKSTLVLHSADGELRYDIGPNGTGAVGSDGMLQQTNGVVTIDVATGKVVQQTPERNFVSGVAMGTLGLLITGLTAIGSAMAESHSVIDGSFLTKGSLSTQPDNMDRTEVTSSFTAYGIEMWAAGVNSIFGGDIMNQGNSGWKLYAQLLAPVAIALTGSYAGSLIGGYYALAFMVGTAIFNVTGGYYSDLIDSVDQDLKSGNESIATFFKHALFEAMSIGRTLFLAGEIDSRSGLNKDIIGGFTYGHAISLMAIAATIYFSGGFGFINGLRSTAQSTLNRSGGNILSQVGKVFDDLIGINGIHAFGRAWLSLDRGTNSILKSFGYMKVLNLGLWTAGQAALDLPANNPMAQIVRYVLSPFAGPVDIELSNLDKLGDNFMFTVKNVIVGDLNQNLQLTAFALVMVLSGPLIQMLGSTRLGSLSGEALELSGEGAFARFVNGIIEEGVKERAVGAVLTSLGLPQNVVEYLVEFIFPGGAAKMNVNARTSTAEINENRGESQTQVVARAGYDTIDGMSTLTNQDPAEVVAHIQEKLDEVLAGRDLVSPDTGTPTVPVSHDGMSSLTDDELESVLSEAKRDSVSPGTQPETGLSINSGMKIQDITDKFGLDDDAVVNWIIIASDKKRIELGDLSAKRGELQTEALFSAVSENLKPSPPTNGLTVSAAKGIIRDLIKRNIVNRDIDININKVAAALSKLVSDNGTDLTKDKLKKGIEANNLLNNAFNNTNIEQLVGQMRGLTYILASATHETSVKDMACDTGTTSEEIIKRLNLTDGQKQQLVPTTELPVSESTDVGTLDDVTLSAIAAVTGRSMSDLAGQAGMKFVSPNLTAKTNLERIGQILAIKTDTEDGKQQLLTKLSGKEYDGDVASINVKMVLGSISDILGISPEQATKNAGLAYNAPLVSGNTDLELLHTELGITEEKLNDKVLAGQIQIRLGDIARILGKTVEEIKTKLASYLENVEDVNENTTINDICKKQSSPISPMALLSAAGINFQTLAELKGMRPEALAKQLGAAYQSPKYVSVWIDDQTGAISYEQQNNIRGEVSTDKIGVNTVYTFRPAKTETSANPLETLSSFIGTLFNSRRFSNTPIVVQNKNGKVIAYFDKVDKITSEVKGGNVIVEGFQRNRNEEGFLGSRQGAREIYKKVASWNFNPADYQGVDITELGSLSLETINARLAGQMNIQGGVVTDINRLIHAMSQNRPFGLKRGDLRVNLENGQYVIRTAVGANAEVREFANQLNQVIAAFLGVKTVQKIDSLSNKIRKFIVEGKQGTIDTQNAEVMEDFVKLLTSEEYLELQDDSPQLPAFAERLASALNDKLKNVTVSEMSADDFQKSFLEAYETTISNPQQKVIEKVAAAFKASGDKTGDFIQKVLEEINAEFGWNIDVGIVSAKLQSVLAGLSEQTAGQDQSSQIEKVLEAAINKDTELSGAIKAGASLIQVCSLRPAQAAKFIEFIVNPTMGHEIGTGEGKTDYLIHLNALAGLINGKNKSVVILSDPGKLGEAYGKVDKASNQEKITNQRTADLYRELLGEGSVAVIDQNTEYNKELLTKVESAKTKVVFTHSSVFGFMTDSKRRRGSIESRLFDVLTKKVQIVQDEIHTIYGQSYIRGNNQDNPLSDDVKTAISTLGAFVAAKKEELIKIGAMEKAGRTGYLELKNLVVTKTKDGKYAIAPVFNDAFFDILADYLSEGGKFSSSDKEAIKAALTSSNYSASNEYVHIRSAVKALARFSLETKGTHYQVVDFNRLAEDVESGTYALSEDFVKNNAQRGLQTVPVSFGRNDITQQYSDPYHAGIKHYFGIMLHASENPGNPTITPNLDTVTTSPESTQANYLEFLSIAKRNGSDISSMTGTYNLIVGMMNALGINVDRSYQNELLLKYVDISDKDVLNIMVEYLGISKDDLIAKKAQMAVREMKNLAQMAEKIADGKVNPQVKDEVVAQLAQQLKNISAEEMTTEGIINCMNKMIVLLNRNSNAAQGIELLELGIAMVNASPLAKAQISSVNRVLMLDAVFSGSIQQIGKDNSSQNYLVVTEAEGFHLMERKQALEKRLTELNQAGADFRYIYHDSQGQWILYTWQDGKFIEKKEPLNFEKDVKETLKDMTDTQTVILCNTGDVFGLDMKTDAHTKFIDIMDSKTLLTTGMQGFGRMRGYSGESGNREFNDRDVYMVMDETELKDLAAELGISNEDDLFVGENSNSLKLSKVFEAL
ncbi:MAG: hypothetical protein KKB82_02545, partial [Candidatus Omnitrophica bacterium]|nr:hypothetical protein [Candidatus Omnitrophota bacterium]